MYAFYSLSLSLIDNRMKFDIKKMVAGVENLNKLLIVIDGR